jgi:glycosyltransferase involved in cell wall biosynthesis
MTPTQNPDRTVEVSLVLPAYNEVDYLTPAVEKTMQALNEFSQSYEIIIAEDGSTDGTAERAQELTKKYPCVKHIHRDARLGRGTALNNAFRQSHAKCWFTWI